MEEKINIDKLGEIKDEDYLDLIETFQSHSNFGERKVYNTLSGLNVFLKFPNVECAALFELNQKEFTFEHRMTSPIEHEESSIKMFGELLGGAVIGKSIQSASILLHPDYSEEIKQYIVIIPLVGQSGVEGLILLGLTKHWRENTEKLFKLCGLQSGYLKFMLENTRLKNSLDGLDSEMEQRISVRLMEISQSKREISAILDSVQTGLIISNADTGDILRVNMVAEDWIGLKEEELVGTDVAKYLENSNQISGAHFESILYNKNGEETVILRKNTIADISAVNYKVESFSDITELKEAQKILENTNEALEDRVLERTYELEEIIKRLTSEMSQREKAETFAQEQEELNKTKSKFMNMISNEFRSPLTIIRSGAELMQHYHKRFTQQEMETYLDRIVTTVDYMTIVLQNILFFNNANDTVVGSSLHKYDMFELLDSVIEQIQKNQSVEREIIIIKSNDVIKTIISPDILRLLFHNLIENAVKFSSVEKPVIVTVEETWTEIHFKVEDEGVGFPEEEIDNIFEIFYRGKNADNKTGVGIGLATVKQSVTFLNGSIDVKSELGKGSIFSVKIPRVHQANHDNIEEEIDYGAIYEID